MSLVDSTAGRIGAVALGGCVGTWARAGVGLLLPGSLGTLGVATIVVNLLGALALGVLVGWGQAQPLRPDVRLAATTGACGAFTTYSGLLLVLDSGTPLRGIAEVAVLLLVGVVAAGAARAWGARAGRAGA